MSFTESAFVVFLLIFFPLYFAIGEKYKRPFTVAASYVFYGWWDARFTLLLAFVTVSGYAAGLLISRSTDQNRRKLLLVSHIVAGLLVLGFFKYFNFFAESLLDITGTGGPNSQHNPILDIVLPIGISFYTFHTMSYVIDVYRRQMPVERSFIQFAEFVAIWPVLVAGPIIRASALMPQLHRPRRWSTPRALWGIHLIVTGYFLKTVMADRLSPLVNKSFENYETISSTTAAVSSVFFSFQIYGDFAGYSLIAIGLGQIMGLNFGKNFARPYFSSDFSDFWRRWHISLSSWLRDYLYIALGGNRRGRIRTQVNLVLTMLIGGLWHGANWTFVIWGGMHGALLVLQRYTARFFPDADRMPAILGWAYRLALRVGFLIIITATWIFFRAETFTQGWVVFTKALGVVTGNLDIPDDIFSVVIGVAIITVVMTAEGFLERASKQTKRAWVNTPTARWIATILMAYAVLAFGEFEGGSFIYFAF